MRFREVQRMNTKCPYCNILLMQTSEENVGQCEVCARILSAGIAQLVERLICNQNVPCSNRGVSI